MLHEKFINSLVNGHANMSDVMCQDSFIGHGMSHGSCIHFRVCVTVCVATCDMIEYGVTWKRILLHSHGIHVCMGLRFTWDSLNHGFT